MTTYVARVRNSVFGFLVYWTVLSIGLFVGFAYVAKDILIIQPLYAYAAAASITLIMAILYGYFAAKKLVFGFNYLTNVVMSVATSTSNVSPPDPNALKGKYLFLNDIANQVYQMAGTQPASTSQAQDGSLPSLAQLAVPAIALGADNTIVYANATAGAYFNFDVQAVVGKNVDQILNLGFAGSEQTLDDWLAYCKDNVATGSQSWDHVKHTISEDSSRLFDMVGHYSKDNPSGYEALLIFVDHTDRYMQEYRDVSFVAMAVHELRTPLTVMRGYLELFEDELGEVLNDEQREFMHNMNAQSETLANFVSNILNVARAEENQLHLKLRKENWADMIRKAVSDMELRARVRGIEIKYSLPENLPEAAVDKVSSYEVLNNLLDNAVKYTHDDRPVRVEVSLKDDSFIETKIIDEGVGIPENVMKHLFKKFYRSYKSSRTATGTGLGLFISKTIVNAQGGEIFAQSKPGEGSTFSFTVPTFASVADKIEAGDDTINREAHGWIKNHSMYRG